MELNGNNPLSYKRSPFGRDKDFLDQLEDVIGQNYSSRSFNLENLSALMKMSKRQVQRRLKSLTGSTPSEYLRSYRLQQSLLQLRQGEAIRDVARAVGFASQAYFASCFKAEFGLTPTDYQRSQN